MKLLDWLRKGPGLAAGLLIAIATLAYATVDRSTPTSGPVSGLAYLTAVNEEIDALWDRVPVTLGTVAGTNTITALASPTLDAYAAGQVYYLTPANTTTAAATLNVDSKGAKNLYNFWGDSLAGGELLANKLYKVYYDGTQFRLLGEPTEFWKALTADDTGGQNVNTAQPWFPTTGTLTLPGSTTWEFEGLLRTSRAAGTTSHTTGILFGGAATLTSIDYFADAMTGDANSLVAVQGFWSTAATSLVIKAASTSATEQTLIRVRGTVRINAGGTFIPQFIYTVAPGGAPTVLRGSFFRMKRVGINTLAAVGPWS